MIAQSYSHIERHHALLGIEQLLLTIEDLLDDRRTVDELDPLLSSRFDEKMDDIQTALEIGDLHGAVEAANWLGSYSLQPYVGGETSRAMYQMWFSARGLRLELIDPLLSLSTTSPSTRSALEEVGAMLQGVEDASVEGFPSDIDFTRCAKRMLSAIDLVQMFASAGALPASFERHFTSRAEMAVRQSCLSICSEVADPGRFGDLVFLSDGEVAEVRAWIEEGIGLAETGDAVGAVENYVYALTRIEDQLDAVRSPLPLDFRHELGNHVLAFETELMEAAEDWWPAERTPAVDVAADQLVDVVLAKDDLNGLVIELASHDPALARAVADANEVAKELAFDGHGDEIAHGYVTVQTQISSHRTLPRSLQSQLLSAIDTYAAALADVSNTLQLLIGPDGGQSCTGEVDPGPGDPDVGLWPNSCCSTMGMPHGDCVGAEGKTCKMEILNIDPPSGEVGCAYAPNTYPCS